MTSDDEFVQIQCPLSEESFVDVDQFSEESSISSCYAQISVGSCVVLGDFDRLNLQQCEAESIAEKSVIIEGGSIGSVFRSAHDAETASHERKEDEGSDSSSFSTTTRDCDSWGIFTNSPRNLTSDNLINTAAELLFVPQDAARKILDHFNLDMNAICENYIGNEESVWSLCNVRHQCIAHRSRDIVPDGQQQVTPKVSPRAIVCLDCGLENHASITCSQFGTWSRKCVEEEESVRWILAQTVKCPKCSHRVATHLAFDEALSLPCEKCGFLFCWTRDTHRASIKSGCKRDALEWFIHCVNLFNFHQRNEDKMKEVRNRFFLGLSITNRSLGGVHCLQAINQLIECHHVLKFCSAALYFRGEKLNDLVEHRQNLLMSLAEDLREVTLGEEKVGKLLLSSRITAVGRFVSSLLDDLDLQCQGNLEPSYDNITTFNTNISQPVDRCDGGQVLWCLHPDCLESVDYFSSDSDLARHYSEAHNGDSRDDGEDCTRFEVSTTSSIKEDDKDNKDFPSLPDREHAVSSIDLSGSDGHGNEPTQLKFQTEIDAWVRLAIKAAALETNYARHKLANMDLPLSLEAYTAFREGGGELPRDLKDAVRIYANSNRVENLKEKLHALLDAAAVARTKLSNLTELIDDQEESDQLFREVRPGFGSQDSRCTFGQLGKQLTNLETWITQFQSGIQLLLSVLKSSEVGRSFELLRCTNEKLKRDMPRLTGASNSNISWEAGKFIETASLQSALDDLSRLIREREVFTHDLQAEASNTPMGNLPTSMDDTMLPNKEGGKVHRRGRPLEDLVLDVQTALSFISIDSEPIGFLSLELPITVLGPMPPPEGRSKATGTNHDLTVDVQQNIEVVTKTALKETVPSLHELCNFRERQAALLEKIEGEHAHFSRALDGADTTFKFGIEYVKAIMGALSIFRRMEREIPQRNCSYSSLARQLDLLEKEVSDAKARMVKARMAAVDADSLGID